MSTTLKHFFVFQDYDAVLPPNSYIFADDFQTNRQLVDYLNYLDGNDTAYLEYFKWRGMEQSNMPDHQRETGLCQLCRVLHGINVDNVFNPKFNTSNYSSIPLFGYPTSPRVVYSVKEEFFGTENLDCA